jgi:hypothetical protein
MIPPHTPLMSATRSPTRASIGAASPRGSGNAEAAQPGPDRGLAR